MRRRIYSRTTGTVYTQAIAGAVTPSGAVVKQSNKILAGIVASIVGLLIRAAARSFVGAIVSAGVAAKQTAKAFTGGLTPAGIVATLKAFGKTLAGAVTPSGALAKQAQEILAGIVASAGTLTTTFLSGGPTLKSLSGTVTSAGNLVAKRALSLAGTFNIPYTNYYLHSEEIDDAIWVKAGGKTTVTANATTAPDGTVTADKIITAGAGTVRNWWYSYPEDSSTTSDVLSFHAKAAECSWVSIHGYGPVVEVVYNVNPSTGAYVKNAGGAESSIDVVAVANGFYRFIITIVGAVHGYEWSLGDSGTSFLSYTGTGGLYLWGVQRQLDSAFVGAYLKTTTTTANSTFNGIIGHLVAARKYFNTLAGGVTPVGVLGRIFLKAILLLTGVVTSAGVIVRRSLKNVIGRVRGVGVGGTPGSLDGAVTVTEDRFQTIDGWGVNNSQLNDPHMLGFAEGTGTPADGIFTTTAQKNELLTLLYDGVTGIGLTRTFPGSRRGMQVVEDGTIDGSDFKSDEQITQLKLILAINPNVKWMMQSQYDPWADTTADKWAKWQKMRLDYWKAQGVIPTWLNVINEPDGPTNATYTHRDKYWLPPRLLAVASVLDADGGYGTMMFSGPQTLNAATASSYMQELIDEGCLSRILAFDSHNYDRNYTALATDATLARQYGRNMWMTEDFEDVADSDGLDWADKMHRFLTGGISTVDYLSGVWGQYGGYQALILLYEAAGTPKTLDHYVIQPQYWTYGQWTKFVRPGAVRLGASDNLGLKTTAFQDAGRRVIVMVNPLNATKTVSLPSGNWRIVQTTPAGADRLAEKGVFDSWASLPALSVTTAIEVGISGALVTLKGRNVAGTVASAGTIVRRTSRLFVGAVVSVGSLLKLARKTFTGAVASAGVLAGVAARLKSLAGTVASAGALGKSARKTFAGAVASAGTLVGRGQKVLAGAVTPAGSLLKLARKTFTGAVASAGVLSAIKIRLRSLAGSVASAGAPVKAASRALSGAAGAIGTLSMRAAKALAGAAAPAGSLAKRAALVRAGAVTSAGVLSTLKFVSKALAGVVTSAGTLAKRAAKAFTGAVASAGALFKGAQLLKAGAVTPAGALTKLAALVKSGAVTSAGALQRKASRALSGVVASAGAAIKRVTKSFSGAVGSAGALALRIAKVLGGIVTPAGALARGVSKALGGFVSSAGNLLTHKLVGLVERALFASRNMVVARWASIGQIVARFASRISTRGKDEDE